MAIKHEITAEKVLHKFATACQLRKKKKNTSGLFDVDILCGGGGQKV